MSANWQLTNQHLKVWSDGSLWLTLHRQKTKVPVNVKLLPIALEILDKYKDSIVSRAASSCRCSPTRSAMNTSRRWPLSAGSTRISPSLPSS